MSKELFYKQIEARVRQRLAETKKSMTEEDIALLCKRIESAGLETMAMIGETAINAESNGARYSADQHLNAIGK